MRGLLLLLVLSVCMSAPARAYYPWDMWQGAQAAKHGDQQAAAAFYRKALKERPNSARALYNLGVSLYRQGKYSQATLLFKRIVNSKNINFGARAAYNLGNTLFRQKKLLGALGAYKKALRWNPSDDDARYNIQVVLDLLKHKHKQHKKNKKDKKNKNKGHKGKHKRHKNRNHKRNHGKNKDHKKKNKGNGHGKRHKQPQGNKKSKEQKAPPRQGAMSRQDAERLLQYFQNKEQQAGNKRVRLYKARPVHGTETW